MELNKSTVEASESVYCLFSLTQEALAEYEKAINRINGVIAQEYLLHGKVKMYKEGKFLCHRFEESLSQAILGPFEHCCLNVNSYFERLDVQRAKMDLENVDDKINEMVMLFDLSDVHKRTLKFYHLWLIANKVAFYVLARKIPESLRYVKAIEEALMRLEILYQDFDPECPMRDEKHPYFYGFVFGGIKYEWEEQNAAFKLGKNRLHEFIELNFFNFFSQLWEFCQEAVASRYLDQEEIVLYAHTLYKFCLRNPNRAFSQANSLRVITLTDVVSSKVRRNFMEEHDNLGSGSFATVFKCKFIDDDERYAIKKISIAEFWDKQMAMLFDTVITDYQKLAWVLFYRVFRDHDVHGIIAHPNLLEMHSVWGEHTNHEVVKKYHKVFETIINLAFQFGRLGNDPYNQYVAKQVWNSTLLVLLTDREFWSQNCTGESTVLEKVMQAFTGFNKEFFFSILASFNPRFLELCREVNKAFLEESPCLCIRMELCDCNLREWFMRENDSLQTTVLPRDQYKKRLGVFHQILSGVHAFHKDGVLHRDLRPENILVKNDENGKIVIKISDFGFSTRSDEPRYDQNFLFEDSLDHTYMMSNVAGWNYSAPEMNTLHFVDDIGDFRYCYGRKVDMFSLGILFLELLLPFGSAENGKRQQLVAAIGSDEQLREAVLKEEPALIKYPVALQAVLDLTSPNPTDRPSAHELLQGPAPLSQEFIDMDILNL